jgi:hypothetical protein
MKGKVSFVLALCLLVVLPSLNIWAQDEKPKAQRYFLEEMVVKPEKVAAFEAGAKEMAAALKKTGFPYPLSVFSRDDNHYFFSFPIENYGDIDKIFEAWSGMVKKWGAENYRALEERMTGTFDSVNYAVIRLAPGMSYVPEKPRLDPTEALYRYWGMCYVKPGKRAQFRKNFRKIVELFKEKNIDAGFETYVVEFGNDTPCIFYAEIGKSAGDFWSHVEITNEQLGDEIWDIWNDTVSCFRRYVPTTGRFRPDLSHLPEKK